MVARVESLSHKNTLELEAWESGAAAIAI